MLRLEERFIRKLEASPESGMGYQHVEVTTLGNRTRTGIVYNADLLSFERDPRARIERAAYESEVRNAKSSSGEVLDVRVLPRAFRAIAVKEQRAAGAPAEAKDAPVEKTESDEVFKRFSAYANDRRVQADGSLSPGTYATTDVDARNASTGSQAVARYALPNPQPASHVFTCNPSANTLIRRGIVAPAYGQPGGGVEVIFPSGTQSKTTTGPIKIPD